MEGVRFQPWSAWPRYSRLQGLGKSGLSGESKLQNSVAVLACLTSMESVKLNPHLTVVTKGGGIAAPVVELRSPRVGMVRHFPGFGQRAVVFQIAGDAGGAHGVIADASLDARRRNVFIE